MAQLTYVLGKIATVASLYPAVEFLDPEVGITDDCAQIAHYVVSSLEQDGFSAPQCAVVKKNRAYEVTITAKGSVTALRQFSERHQAMLTPEIGGKAIEGMKLMQQLGVWNPMEGFPVNGSPTDGDCKWSIFLPHGMGILNHQAVLLLHYPPWQALREGSYLNNMTLQRWVRLLGCVGIPEEQMGAYKTIMDVNPVAAPGSGQSEYPNDFFPMMMSSAFFDSGPRRDYIRSMLELLLNPPHRKKGKMTLPLLVGGSPLYDPQAPGWLRATWKNDMPKDKTTGVPKADVLQTGSIRIRPDSKRLTPYLITNHMIAAGVTGQCTNDPTTIPDIRKYEAQDLVAASFLAEYAKNPDITPEEAKAAACQRWFNNDDGSGAPNPPKPADKLILCALAQMDLFFTPTPMPHPTYSMEEAMARCKEAGADGDACAACIAPKPKRKSKSKK